jgi:O-antigen/teichoic acid export membrane protein
MLIRHSGIYLAGRIVPGVVSILSLALLTRLMSAEQYGDYALLMTIVGIINAVCFQWLALAVGRFLPNAGADPRMLLSTTLATFVVLVGMTGAVGGCAALLCQDPRLRGFILLATVAGWAQAWFDLNLKIINTRLAPVSYGLISSAKALLVLVGGAGLFYVGFGVEGVVLGFIAGLLLSACVAWKQWRGLRIGPWNTPLVKRLIAYGVPLALTIMLTLVLDVSDRFLLNWFLGSKSVGAYASAYDLAQQSLGMLMGVVHLAAFPLALRAFEDKGLAAAQEQLRSNLLMLLVISVPATVGLMLLADNIAFVMLGAEFRADAGNIIRVVALAIFVGGIKSYYCDYCFQLGGQLTGQVRAVMWAALANIVLNLWWIPLFGVLGAAYATLGGFGVGLGVSWYLGRKVFPLPRLPSDWYKVAGAALAMGFALAPSLLWRGPLALFSQILIGCIAFAACALLFNIGESRAALRRYWK